MEYEEMLNSYYIRVNKKGRIIKAFSTVFEQPNDNDIKIGEGTGSQFRATSTVLSKELQQYSNIENGLPLTNEEMQYNLTYNYEKMIIEYVSESTLQEEKVTEVQTFKASLNENQLFYDTAENKQYYKDSENNKVYI